MTIVVNGAYLVGSGESLNDTTDQDAFLLHDAGGPALIIAGSVQLSGSSDAGVVAVEDDGAGYSGSIAITATGSLTVTGTGSASAVGYDSGTWAATFENDGVVSVSSAQSAIGVEQYEGYPYGGNMPLFKNTGVFTVSASIATGVSMGYMGIGINTGDVEVHGVLGAHAFDLGSFLYQGSFTNSGTIVATATSATSYAITFSGSYSPDSPMVITNSGTITAQHAIYELDALSPAQTPRLFLFNTGTINGDIVPGQGPDQYHAAGQTPGSLILSPGEINGAVNLDTNGNAVFDARGGTQTGGINLGAGLDVVFLGADGETVNGGSGQAVVIGGSGADTVTGGSGADLIDGGGGDDTLTGGGGADTFRVTSTDGAAVVTDFSHAQGDRIDLSALGFITSLADVQANASQVGADTIVSLGAGTLTLKNVTLANLTVFDFVFPTAYGSLGVSSDTTLTGVHVFTGDNGGAAPYTISGTTTLMDSGVVLVENNQNGAVLAGVDTAGASGTPTLRLYGGSLVVDAAGAGGSAYGFRPGLTANLTNEELISVSATGRATGALLNGFGNVHNTGLIEAFGDVAHGIETIANSSVGAGAYSNVGAIRASGVSEAAGFSLGSVSNMELGNGGSIIATASSGAAYGVKYGGLAGQVLEITNSGVITAQYAIFAAGGAAAAANISNSGTINGEIHLGHGPSAIDNQLSGYDDELTNTGAIHGAVYLGDGRNDFYDGRGGAQTGGFYLGSGLVTLHLGNDGETVNGGTGGAIVYGGGGADTVTGGSGNDLIDGGAGNDALDGGSGLNTVSYASAASAVAISLALQGQAQDSGGAGVDTLSNFQNLTGSAFNDTLTGDAGANVIDGGGGNDVLDGGGGVNTLSFASATSGVDVSLGLQGHSQATGVGSDTLSNFQNLTGSAYNDTVQGDANDNVLDGGAGTNTVTYANATSGVTVSLALHGQAQATGEGVDTLSNFQNLIGSAFDDTLEGDGDNNVVGGGLGTNTITYAHAASGVTVSLALQGQAQATGGAGTDTLSDFLNVTGSAFNDTLEGDVHDNVLDGGLGINTVSYAHAASGVTVSLALQAQAQNTVAAGHDTLFDFQNLTGSAFNDTLEGDGNNNVLDGGGGTNTASYAHAAAGVTVSLALQGQAQNTGGAGTDTLSNFQSLIGSAFDDTLTGSTGASSLTGGAGADTFKIAAGAANTTITDFSHAQGDSIDLTALSQFTSLADVMASATQVGSNTVINLGSGSITLDNVTAATLTASDFAFGAAPPPPPPPSAVPLNYPYDCVCYISDVIDGVAYRASGVIVGPHTILTAAHVVWNKTTGQSATDIVITPGLNSTTTTSFAGVAIHFNPIDNTNNLLSKAQSQSDFAVIDVAQNLTAYGWFGIDPDYAGGSGQIAGYPAANGHTQQDTTGTLIVDTSYDLFDYSSQFLVSPGSSGGPLWIDEGSSSPLPNVVGVVSTADWGARITASDLTQLKNWVSQDTGLWVDAPGDTKGSMFDDHLVGDSGANVLDGKGGNDTFTGGGGGDTFVFEADDGQDVITDFSAVQGDRIDLSQVHLFSSLGEVLAASSQVGGDTLIAIGGGTLRLAGVTMSSLTAADFGLPAGPAVGPGIGGAPTAGSGTINGTSGSDWLQGGGGNDTLHGGAGSDYIEGGLGLNAALYDGALRQYTVSTAGGTVSGGPEGGTDVLVNVQRIQFVDGYLAISPSDTAGQVYRVYEATLGRAPDQEGLTNWVDALNAGSSLQSVVNGFTGSQEFQADYGNVSDSQFVTLLYENVLHRAPDQAGLDNWVGVLAGGESRAQVVTGFSESQEDIADLSAPVQEGLWIADPAAGQVARLYDTVLGRLPDGAGLANWTHMLESGTSLQMAADGFVGSAEFQAAYGSLSNNDFVSLLYHNVLHRDADQTGLTNWVSSLDGGETRAQVVVGFSESAEHVTNMAPYIDSGIWLAG